MSRKQWVLTALLSVLAACGGDSPTAPGGGGGGAATFENIAGSYSGLIAGVSQGFTVSATFSITITQSGGTLGGSYSIAGTLTDATGASGSFEGSGSLVGTINSGQNPSVNVTAISGICTNVQSPFSGSYDSTNRKITLSGPLDFFDENCNVTLSIPLTVILSL